MNKKPIHWPNNIRWNNNIIIVSELQTYPPIYVLKTGERIQGVLKRKMSADKVKSRSRRKQKSKSKTKSRRVLKAKSKSRRKSKSKAKSRRKRYNKIDGGDSQTLLLFKELKRKDPKPNYNRVIDLIRHGADVNVKQGDIPGLKKSQKPDLRPLFYASAHGDDMKILVNILLHNGADVSVTNLPLTNAIRTHANKIIKILISHGMNVNKLYDKNITPLQVAAKTENSEEAIELLVNAGADLEAKDKSKYTPLIYACKYNNYENVKMLVKLGANINNKTSRGRNALHISLEDDNKDISKFLIENGINTELVDNYNRLPSDNNEELYDEIMEELAYSN